MDRMFVGTLAIVVCGCGTGAVPDATEASRQHSQTVPATDAAQTNSRDPSAQTRVQAPHQAAQQRPTGSKMAIAPLLPRPIESERDAQECMAAPAKFNRQIEEVTGAASASQMVRLHDCVIDYDRNNRGWIKFYPGGARARLYLRSQRAANLNVFKVGLSRSVVHVTVDEFDNGMALIYAECHNPTRSQSIQVSFHKPSDSAELARTQRGDWDKIADPDTLRDFCLETYNEIRSLRKY